MYSEVKWYFPKTKPGQLLCTPLTNTDNPSCVYFIKEISKPLEIKNKYDDEEDENEYEEMFVKTKFNNIEWGGPLRGGRMPEPTRFGDWERKGRCTDY